MESNGAVKIFHRLIEKHGVRYVNYIGDGDYSAFSKVLESNPFGMYWTYSKAGWGKSCTVNPRK